MSVSATKVASGLGWVATVSYSNKLLQFLTLLVLAKLLEPEDFGLVAVASVVINLLYLCKDLGIGQALIYQQDDSDTGISTAIILVTAVNGVLFLLAAAFSPLVARFYDEPSLTPILIILASNLIWMGLRSAPEAKLRKNLEFRKLVVPQVVPMFAASSIAILMAFQGFGVWSLVARSQIMNILAALLIFRYADVRPSLRFDRDRARQLFSYGKFIIGTSVFIVLFYNIDKLFISRWGGIAVLGFYTLAMRIASLPVSELSHIICNVMFPVLSGLEGQPEKLRDTFRKMIRYNILLSVPMTLGILAFVPPLVLIVYGEKWAPMNAPLQLLAIYSLFRAASSLIHETFKATGVPYLMQRFMILRLAILIVAGAPAMYYFGLNVFCLAMAAMNCVVTITEMFVITKRMQIPISEFVRPVLLPVLLSTALIAPVYFALVRYGLLDSLPALIAGVLFIAAAYVGIVLMLDGFLQQQVRRILSRKSRGQRIT